jgi:hypothetical protein
MAKRYLLVHNTLGVYLGHCMGLGFWSKLDAAGQTEAVTFESPRQAHDHVYTWDSPKLDGYHPVTAPIDIPSNQINADGSAAASMLQVVNAGFESWAP